MDARSLARSTLGRLRSPTTWGALLAFEGAWIATRRLSGIPLKGIGAWEFFVPALFLLGHLALSAAPWQWSGNPKAHAPLWRGVLQALVWDSAWVFIFIGCVRDVVKPLPPATGPIQPAARPPRPGAPPPRPDAPPPRPDAPPPRPDAPPPRPDAPPPRPDAPPPRPDARQEPPPRPGSPATDQPPREPARRDSPPPPPAGPPQELNLLYLNLPFALVIGWFLSGKEEAESGMEELREKENRARALALQAQLQPHALFNVLGGLAELVHEDPDATEKGLLDLSEMMRMLTRQATALRIPLAQERALLRRYLAIEAMRLGDRLKVRWVWPEWADTVELPPLLLQPLVENAVKHGIAPCPEGGEVVIEVRRVGPGLMLRVTNTGRPWKPSDGEGTGLSNMRERLRLMPELGGSLILRSEDGRTLAELRLKAIVGK
jgi:hypothetical protein